MRLIYTTILMLICAVSAWAQMIPTSHNDELEQIYERYAIRYPQTDLFQDAKPYHSAQIYDLFTRKYIEDTSFTDPFAHPYLANELHGYCTFAKHTKSKKLSGFFYPYDGALAAVRDSLLFLRVNPILELKAGTELGGSGMPYANTRGIEISGDIGGSIQFYGQITENQLRPFRYVNAYGSGFYGQDSYNFNPQYTYWKDINQGAGYDFSNSIGTVAIEPRSWVRLTIGHDRNHYGYGYRSLFLGDNGAPYFQFKGDIQLWKLKYQVLFTQFTGQYVRGADRLLPKKYGAFHLLSYKPSKKLELGFFEGVIFNRTDGFDLNYLNPIIFYRAVEHSLGSPDNVMMGWQGKFQPNTHTQFYTQLLIDDMQVGEMLKSSGWWGNKYGVQLGCKVIDIANVPTLDAQFEFNAVSPYTYSHTQDSGEANINNFTHYNQPLAHPFGANFIEVYTKLAYRPHPRLQLELSYDFSARGLDDPTQLNGNNIFANMNGNNVRRLYGNTITQGERTAIHYLNLNAQYQIFHNIFLEADVLRRSSENTLASNSMIGMMGGIRMNFRRREMFY